MSVEASGDDLVRRALPFGAVGALGLASLALPPGPSSAVDALVAVALLTAAAVGLYVGRAYLATSRLAVLVPLTYMAGVLMMILATGSITSGVGVIVLAPLIWTALYHRRWDSAVMVGAVAVVQLIVSVTPVVQPGAATARRLIFWMILAGLLSIAAHRLRDGLTLEARAHEEALRRTLALEQAAEELTVLRDPDEVLAAAVRLTAQLVAPPGDAARRAQYVRVEDEVVRFVEQYDETGEFHVDAFPLADHPHLLNVLLTGEPQSVELDVEAAGPTIAALIGRLGVTHSVYVPVHLGGRVDGVLAVSLSSGALAAELFEQCKALGRLLELALDNALAHRELEREATTDPLTGLLNRRGFERSAADLPGRRPYVMMSIDLDGLKAVNDTAGHDAGDALLVRVAGTVRSTMRRGDLLARLGGDEFAALLFDADEVDGRIAAERMLGALVSPESHLAASASIGLVAAAADDDPIEALTAADGAMYLAKRSGGRTYHVAHPFTRAF